MNKKAKTSVVILILATTVMSCLCGLPATLIPAGSGPAGVGTPISGSNGLTATAMSPVTVQINWTAVVGAKSYLIELQIGTSDFFQLVELPGDQTSFVNFPAPDDSQLTYRVTAVTAAGNGEARTVSLTTAAVTPNPITVQAHEYPNQPWMPPTPAPNSTLDPSSLYPPGYDPNNPGSFDPSSLIGAPPTASALIGPEGGSISVTSPDNITYTLDVPAGAVEDSIVITLTPIQSLDNLPLSGGLLGAVMIDPQGFTLEVPATLTISLPEEVPPASDKTDVAFAFNGDGSEFHLVPMEPPSQTATGGLHTVAFDLGGLATNSNQSGYKGNVTLINNLGGKGTGSVTQKDIRTLVENHPPSFRMRQLDQAMAAIQTFDKFGLFPSSATYTELALAKIENQLSDSSDTPFSFLETIETIHEYYMQEIFVEKDLVPLSPLSGKIWDKMIGLAKDNLDNYKADCFDNPNLTLLAQNLTDPKDQFWIAFEQRMNSKFDIGYLGGIALQADGCIFKLTIKSTVTLIGSTPGAGDVTTTTSINAEIPLTWVKDKNSTGIVLSGTGPIIYTDWKVTISLCPDIVFKPDTTEGSTFTVISLKPIFDDQGQLIDFALEDYGARGLLRKISASGHCDSPQNGSGSSTGSGSGDLWGGLFTEAIMPNMAITEWNLKDLSGLNVMAERLLNVVDKSLANQGGSSITITEHTTFTIVKK